MEIGRKLQYYRKLRGMSLRDVARNAHCSASFLSQVELERASPTLKSLEKICGALSTTVADFLRADSPVNHPVTVSRDRSQYKVAMSWSSARLLHILAPEVQSPFTALLLVMDVAGNTPRRSALQSCKELATVLKGQIKFDCGAESYLLEAGDSIYFDQATQHQWWNTGDVPAEVLMTNPNAFILFEQDEENVRWQMRSKRLRRKKRSTEGAPPAEEKS
jgi:transcriptional regulator with XRE-family HTH domain